VCGDIIFNFNNDTAALNCENVAIHLLSKHVKLASILAPSFWIEIVIYM